MKRCVVLILILSLILALTACEGTPGESTDTSQDSDRSFMNSLGMCATGDTIYFLQTSNIYYVDKETGIGGPLCGKPECEHNDKTCNAYSGGGITSCLSVYDGRLYWINSYPFLTLMSCSLDGTDHQTVRDLSADPLPHYNMIKAVFHRGTMYLYLMEDSIEDGEVEYVMRLFAVPLGPEEEIYEIFSERPITETVYYPIFYMQACGDALYFSTHAYAGKKEEDVHFYQYTFYRFDITNRELDMLYRDDDFLESSSSEFWVAEDGIVFEDFVGEDVFDTSAYNISKLDFESGQVTPIIPGEVGHVSANLIVRDMGSQMGQLSEENGIDREISFGMRIMDFEGNVLVEDTYSFTGPYVHPLFRGVDENCAYYYDFLGGGGHYLSVFAVALDGSGARVLCTVKE